MVLLQDTIRRRAQVVARDVTDGAVLVDMVDGRCFELNRVGGLFWSNLDATRTIAQICQALLPDLRATREMLEVDLCRLADDLFRAGLVERVASSESLAP